MKDWILNIFSVVLAVFQLSHSDATGCKSKPAVAYVKIPDLKHLMSIQDFDEFIVNRRMGEVYYAMPKPPAYTPDIHFFTTVTKVAGTSNYFQSSIGESVEQNPRCARYESPLKVVPSTDRAVFMLENTNKVQVYWSSCPTSYLLSMICDNYYVGKKKCAIADSTFSIYLHGNLDDAPLIDIARDLCNATDVKFGDANFKWFFSFGENNLC